MRCVSPRGVRTDRSVHLCSTSYPLEQSGKCSGDDMGVFWDMGDGFFGRECRAGFVSLMVFFVLCVRGVLMFRYVFEKSIFLLNGLNFF